MSGVAKVSVSVAVAPALAFELFTGDIDRWWLRGARFRNAGSRRGLIHLEPRLGGRLFESFDGQAGVTVIEVGRVVAWEPPGRVVLAWRNVNFAPDEATEVEIQFAASGDGTLVSVTHRGLTALRADHPARHGNADGPFLRMIGLWWGDQMTSYRELCAAP